MILCWLQYLLVWCIYRHHYHIFYGWIIKPFPCVSRNYLGLSIFVLVVQTFIFLAVCKGMTDVADGPFFSLHATFSILLVSLYLSSYIFSFSSVFSVI